MRKQRRAGVLTFLKCFSAHSLFMQSNMYSRLETSPSLFLALTGIFQARFFSRAPRIPVNPDIRESRYSSEAQKGFVSSLHVIQDGCSVCAHDDMMIYS